MSDAFVAVEHAGGFDVIGPVMTWSACRTWVRTTVIAGFRHREQADTAARMMNIVAERASEIASDSRNAPGWAWIDAADEAARSVLDVAPFMDDAGLRAVQLAAETGACAAVLEQPLDVLVVSAERSINVSERSATAKGAA